MPSQFETRRRLHSPIMITRGPKRRAVLAHTDRLVARHSKDMAERLSEVEAALPEIFEAFNATDSFVIAERAKVACIGPTS